MSVQSTIKFQNLTHQLSDISKTFLSELEPDELSQLRLSLSRADALVREEQSHRFKSHRKSPNRK